MPLDWTALVNTALQVGGSLISSNASSQATNTQVNNLGAALNLQRDIYNTTRGDFTPYRAVGQNALFDLASALGVSTNGINASPTGIGGATNQTPGVQAALSAGTGTGGATPLINAGGAAVGAYFGGPIGSIVGERAGNFLGDVFGANNASPLQDIAAALSRGEAISDASWAKAGYGPGGTALNGSSPTNVGVVNQPTAGGTAGGTQYGATATTPGGATAGTGFQASPGYQFAFNEGVKAVDAGAATSGLIGSGARLKALTEFGQGIANQEYYNYLDRLFNLSDQGRLAAGMSADAGQNYASNAGNIYEGIGSVKAYNAANQGNILQDAFQGLFGNGIQNSPLGGLFGGGGPTGQPTSILPGEWDWMRNGWGGMSGTPSYGYIY